MGAPKPWVEGSGSGAGAGATLPVPPPSWPFLLCWQLARAGVVGSQGAQLLLEVSERVRSLTQAYFSPDRPLHLSFTHLVCRSAIEGNRQGPCRSAPASGPLGAVAPHTFRSPSHVRPSLHCTRTDSPAQAGPGCDPGAAGWVSVGGHRAAGRPPGPFASQESRHSAWT